VTDASLTSRVRATLARDASVWLGYVLLCVLAICTEVISPGFAGRDGFSLVATQATFLGIAALGQTFVIITGGVDLSVSSLISMAAVMVSALCHGHNDALIWVIPLVLAVGLIVGLINGTGVALGVSPIIMTLGTQGVVLGALLLYTKGTAGFAPPSAVTWIANHRWGPLPVAVVAWVLIGVPAAFLLRRTIYGRHVYAVGASATVAHFSGVNLPRVRIASYVISALAAVVAGVGVAGYVGQTYLTVGDPYLFTSVAAVVVGGASILGGSGRYAGTVAGALTLTLLINLLDILNLTQGIIDIIYGAVILVAVAFATRRSESTTT
jgi:ribose transport system permease protein